MSTKKRWMLALVTIAASTGAWPQFDYDPNFWAAEYRKLFPSGPREIRPAHNLSQCLDVEHNQARAGARVIQWPCSGAPNQKFTADIGIVGGHARARIMAFNGKFCLTSNEPRVRGHATGKAVTIEPCNESRAQAFELFQPNYVRSVLIEFRLMGIEPAGNFDIYEASTGAGAPLITWRRKGTEGSDGPNQLFQIR